jgi:small subunit ribosomal protein S9
MSAETNSDVILTIGRRKTASARIRMKRSGTGKYVVNGKEMSIYCYNETLLQAAQAPLNTVESLESFDADIKVTGGGPNGQAGAMAHGLARALEKFNPEWRIPLKRAGHLKRDPRQKERKKAGQPGARKRFQFSKR